MNFVMDASGDLRSGGGCVAGRAPLPVPPQVSASAGRRDANDLQMEDYCLTHQSSMFHMSDEVPGFFSKFWSRTETPRASWR